MFCSNGRRELIHLKDAAKMFHSLAHLENKFLIAIINL